MGIDAKEKTAQSTSVGADERQSIQKDSDNSIPASEAKGNEEMGNLEEMYRRMQRMADPRYLHTLTMTELFQTSYKSRPDVYKRQGPGDRLYLRLSIKRSINKAGGRLFRAAACRFFIYFSHRASSTGQTGSISSVAK